MLITERTGVVLTVSMSNPPFNFLDTALMRELEDLLLVVHADRDPRVRAAVLTSAMSDVFISHRSVATILDGSERSGLSLPVPIAAAALRALSPRSARLRADCGHRRTAALPCGDRPNAGSSTVLLAALNSRALGGRSASCVSVGAAGWRRLDGPGRQSGLLRRLTG
ncbi:hypothetical protein [Nocardia terpenica]|uniref:hypothetical protein n=1 Tax=Nocardia terpenica TaxID=455432 RepID=UPI0015C527F1|nr:hypothetical protein [Nocardia terpenica]NQE91207.1 hypothetical protein [Nocardia terpenica]